MSQPKLLLLPGNMCDHRVWAPVQMRLAAAGVPSVATDALDKDEIAAIAEAILAAHNGPLLPIGFSMGAIVAATMGVLAPARIAGLGLVAFNASADLPERTAARPRQQAAVRRGELAAVVSNELMPNYLAPANSDDVVLHALLMAMALDVGVEMFVRQSEALRRRDDLRPALPSLAMPVLLTTGAEDRLCPPAWHEAWQAAIGERASLRVVAEAGHMLPLEQPDALASTIIDWIERERLWA